MSDEGIEGIVSELPAKQTHWMALQMGELTAMDICMSRLWIDVDSDPYSIPVAKTFLHKLLDAAEKGVRL